MGPPVAAKPLLARMAALTVGSRGNSPPAESSDASVSTQRRCSSWYPNAGKDLMTTAWWWESGVGRRAGPGGGVTPPHRHWRRLLAGNEAVIRWLARPGAAPAVRWLLSVGQGPALTLAAKALPNLIAAGVMPAVCFLAGRRLWGLAGQLFGVGVERGMSGCPSAVGQAALRPADHRSGRTALAGLGGARPQVKPSVFRRARHRHRRHRRRLHRFGVHLPPVGKVVAGPVPGSVLDVNDSRLAVLLRKGSLLYGAEQLPVVVVSLVMVVNFSTTVY